MKIIGVTGGVGAGKSSVLDYLHTKYDAVIVRLDDVSRAMLDPDGRCYQAVIDLFGPNIIREDGTLDRAQIAGIVFSDPSMIIKLNAIVHPAVRLETEKIIETNRKEGTNLLVLEAALLIEQHYDKICDELWYVYADVETRIRRLTSSRGYTRERSLGMISSQLDEDAFRNGSSFVLDNDGEFEATKIQIDRHFAGKD